LAPLKTPFCFPTWAFSQLLRLPASKGRLPKYSFSDAKLRFWWLVSEKNICVGIPNGINRSALVSFLQIFHSFSNQVIGLFYCNFNP